MAGTSKSVSRRAFVGALAGAPMLVPALLPAVRAGALARPAAALPLPPGAETLGQGTFQLFAAPDLNFQTLIALGGAGINAAVGEVITAVDQANAAPGGASYQSLFDAMVATGNRMVEAADAAAKKKHTVTARERYLRAGQYYNQALYWVLGTSTPDREAEVYRAMNDAWKQAAKRAVPVWEPVSIPYGGSTLPAWFLKPASGGGRRPTLIMNNGSDGQNVDMLPQGGSAALARGWNVLVFEGPGQGQMLFERRIPFTPDWHDVMSPIVDVLQKRGDVDPKRIALLGVSFGGLLVMRAAAFEHRLAAVVPDPGSYDDFHRLPRGAAQRREQPATRRRSTGPGPTSSSRVRRRRTSSRSRRGSRSSRPRPTTRRSRGRCRPTGTRSRARSRSSRSAISRNR